MYIYHSSFIKRLVCSLSMLAYGKAACCDAPAPLPLLLADGFAFCDIWSSILITTPKPFAILPRLFKNHRCRFYESGIFANFFIR
jgi:hypothetical protein